MAKDKVTQKTFQDPLIRVLGNKTKYQADAPVHHNDVYSEVCALAGVEEEEFGIAKGTKKLQTHRWIGFAFRELRSQQVTSSPKKGHWCLTEEGVRQAKELNGIEEEEAPIAEDPVSSAAKTLDTAAAEVKLPESTPQRPQRAEVVRLPVAPRPYSEDPYLRSLAIDSTACFGSYSNRSSECEECHLSTDCIINQRSFKSKLANKLRREAAKASAPKKNKKAPKKAPPKKASTDTGIDDLISSLSEESNSDHIQALKDAGWMQIPIKADTSCATCGELIKKGEEAWWKSGKGSHHTECTKNFDLG